jgi:acyl-CoA dehydrogenase
VKATTGRQAVQVVSETIESFGGAGYVEDTGLPVLLRDAQVLPIWEGTTNVLSLDAVLRADAARALPALQSRVRRIAESCGAGAAPFAASALRAIDHAATWLASAGDAAVVQAGARRVTLTLGRALQLALLAEHAGAVDGAARVEAVDWCRRLQRAGLDLLGDAAPGSRQ